MDGFNTDYSEAVQELQQKLNRERDEKFNLESQRASFQDCLNTFCREEGVAQCDAMDADLRPFLSELVYKLRRKWMKAVDAIQRKKGGA